MKLYAWQEECLRAWEENGWQGIVHVITGAGKTVTAMEGMLRLEKSLAEKGQKLRTRIVVPTTALALQWYKGMEAFLLSRGAGERRIGLFFGERKDDMNAEILILVVNSARFGLSRQILEDQKQGFWVFLIADECHHYGGEENRKIFSFRMQQAFQPLRYASMGLSATPQCAAYDEVLVPSLGQEIYWYGLRQAVWERRVSPYAVLPVKLPLSGEERMRYGEITEKIHRLHPRLMHAFPELKGLSPQAFMAVLQKLAKGENGVAAAYLNLVYQRRSLVVLASSRAECAGLLVSRLPRKEKILFFCEKIRQAEGGFRSLYESYPSRVGIYHSGLPRDTRERVLRDFRDGVIQVLVSCKALDEGVDVPDAGMGVIVSTTQATRQRIQRLGRILRRAEGKHMAVLYYFYIPEALEECEYLPETGDGHPTAYLTYYPREAMIDCDVYDDLAIALLVFMHRRGYTDRRLREACRYLEEGRVLPDWLGTPSELRRRLREAQDPDRRRYLVCMLKMAQLYEARLAGQLPGDSTPEERRRIRNLWECPGPVPARDEPEEGGCLEGKEVLFLDAAGEGAQDGNGTSSRQDTEGRRED